MTVRELANTFMHGCRVYIGNYNKGWIIENERNLDLKEPFASLRVSSWHLDFNEEICDYVLFVMVRE